MANRALALFLIVALMIVWATTYIATKVVMDQTPPLLLALLRFLCAIVILMPLALLRGGFKKLPRPLPIGSLIIMSVCGFVLYYVGFNYALVYTSASQGALVQALLPAGIAIAAALYLRERPSPQRLLGIALSIGGVALVVLFGKSDTAARDPVLGALLMLTTVITWSVYTVLAKRFAQADQIVVTTFTMAIGIVLLLPLVLLEMHGRAWPQLSGADWANIAYLGVVASGAAYIVYSRALRDLDASTVGVYINLVPIIGVITAVLFLGESLNPWQIAGAVIAVAGMWLSS
jgi:drug/metabolite transporter (DMT)-like permease